MAAGRGPSLGRGASLRRRRPGPKTTWRHFIYLGVFGLDQAAEELERHFGADPDSSGERPMGLACLAAFAVTEAGRPLIDSYTLSSLAWSLGRTRSLGPGSPGWLEGFDEAQSHARESFASRMSLAPDDEEGQRITGKGFRIGPPLGSQPLEEELACLLDVLGWPRAPSDFKALGYIRSAPVASRRKYSVDDVDFLNSFFVNDLRRVANAFAEGRTGSAIRTYLSNPDRIDRNRRIDLRRDHGVVSAALQPREFPAARWPSPGHKPLVLSQQFAINALVRDLSDRPGLFAINGPPGSGKTTLLRDLVAAVLVRRAEVLASLSSPLEAFTERTEKWRSGQYWRSIRFLRPALCGHEIVVASSNNGAVENVTREIPAQRAVDASWLNFERSYFADAGSAVIGEPAWGLLAAPLGNKQNRSSFLSRFWYGPKEDDEAWGSGSSESEEDRASSWEGFLDLLKAAEESAPPSWPDAVRRFRSFRDWVAVLTDDRQKVADAVERIPQIQEELAKLEAATGEQQGRLDAARTELAHRQAGLRQAMEQARFAQEQLNATQQARPGFMDVLFTWGRAFREWSGEARERRTRLDEAHKAQTVAEQEVAAAKRECTRLEAELTSLSDARKGACEQLEAAQARIRLFQETTGARIPTGTFWDWEGRELQSPWVDERWNRARAELFLEALQLHKTFLLSVPDLMRKNLQGAMDVLGGQLPGDAPVSAIRMAWASLFLVVPVVSTTFASFDRLFPCIGQEGLGWLLIDEAGQAVPQAAVGAIWRAKRAVVVGDPQQLEPVVTIPDSVVSALRSHFGVDRSWQPNALSAQSLADRSMALGTYLPGADDKVWVGAPLRVHRRCEEPMFSVANRIAYDGMMIYGTPSRIEADEWPESCWLDVEATESEGNWVPEEGQAVLALMKSFPSKESVVCLSPFRDTVFGLREMLRHEFPDVHVGTVHTYQGKETDAVVLVLGGSVNREGALNWAASRPNLLNVAVTRARRRLYVVGNRRRWKTRTYFSDLVRSLPVSQGIQLRIL